MGTINFNFDIVQVIESLKNTSPKQRASVVDHTIILFASIAAFLTLTVDNNSDNLWNLLRLDLLITLTYIFIFFMVCLFITKFIK